MNQEPPAPKPGEEPRGGSLCYMDSTGIWRYCSPGDPMFSTVTMVATHYWGEGRWKPIWNDNAN